MESKEDETTTSLLLVTVMHSAAHVAMRLEAAPDAQRPTPPRCSSEVLSPTRVCQMCLMTRGGPLFSLREPVQIAHRRMLRSARRSSHGRKSQSRSRSATIGVRFFFFCWLFPVAEIHVVFFKSPQHVFFFLCPRLQCCDFMKELPSTAPDSLSCLK